MRAPFERFGRAWSRFWFAPVDARPFALVRIGVALAGLQLWAGTLPLARHFYSDAGEFPIAAARAWSVEHVARFLMLDALGSFAAVAVLFALWGVVLVALLLGWRTRAAAWLNWLLVLWFYYRNATFTNGGDEVLRLVSMYLALGYTAVGPSSRALSLDRLRALGEGPHAPPTMTAWPLRFVQIQICIVYFVSGFWKVVGAPWWDGSALHYALGNEAFSRFGAPEWPWAGTLYAVLTLSAAWWEMLFPALVVFVRTRIATLVFGVGMHVFILAFMNIGVFPFVMLACYPAFLKPVEAAALVAWARTRLGGRRAQASVASSSTAATQSA